MAVASRYWVTLFPCVNETYFALLSTCLWKSKCQSVSSILCETRYCGLSSYTLLKFVPNVLRDVQANSSVTKQRYVIRIRAETTYRHHPFLCTCFPETLVVSTVYTLRHGAFLDISPTIPPSTSLTPHPYTMPP